MWNMNRRTCGQNIWAGTNWKSHAAAAIRRLEAFGHSRRILGQRQETCVCLFNKSLSITSDIDDVVCAASLWAAGARREARLLRGDDVGRRARLVGFLTAAQERTWTPLSRKTLRLLFHQLWALTGSTLSLLGNFQQQQKKKQRRRSKRKSHRCWAVC